MENSEFLDIFFGQWKNEHVKYVSEKGENICDECRKNDGRVFSINDENLPRLPIHPHCRCKYVLLLNPYQDVTLAVERKRACAMLKKKYHLDDSMVDELARQIIAARKENPIIGNQQRFLLFNGRYLFSNDGELLLDAVSGKPVSEHVISEETYAYGAIRTEKEREFDYSYSRQGIKGIGGIPQGVYYIETDEERSAKTSPYSHFIRSYGWGDYSWSLHPVFSTDIRGRSGFFVHGGSEFGSAGCIDLQKNDKAFHDYLQQINQSSLFILVNYAKEKVTIRENKTNLIHFVPKMD